MPVSCTFCGFVHLQALVLVFIILIKFTAKGRRLTEVDNSPKSTELVALKPEFEPRQSYTLSSSVWKSDRERTPGILWPRQHDLRAGKPAVCSLIRVSKGAGQSPYAPFSVLEASAWCGGVLVNFDRPLS